MVKSIGVVGFYDSPTCTDFEYKLNSKEELEYIFTGDLHQVPKIKKDGQTNRREQRKLKRK